MESIATKAIPCAVALSAYATGAIGSDPTPTNTEPTGTGVIDVFTLGGVAFSNLSLAFFGQGNAGDTASVKVFLWFKLGSLWFPVQVLDGTVTLGAATGVANDPNITTSDKFVKSIATGTATTTGLKDLVSPNTSNGVALVDFDLHGAVKVQVMLGVNTATKINALWRAYT